MPAKVRLTLEDGSVFEGSGFGHIGTAAGEVVFNTGMVGYPEALTDPSYNGQILVLTYPLIGNYGVPPAERDMFDLPLGLESEKIQAAGLIVSEQSSEFSHHGSGRSLKQWLAQEKIPAISGIDTRALTKRLREKGSMLGKIETADEEIAFFNPNMTNLASAVSPTDLVWMEAPGEDSKNVNPTVVLIDCGCKMAIVRSLLSRKINVMRVPYNYYFLNINFDGLVISNGPGDPKMFESTTNNVRRALAVGRPILGICLGNQLLARAVGAETYKLKFGHRGHNQPCLEIKESLSDTNTDSHRCLITSQNHGYAVSEEGLPEDWKVWFRNANDGTVEGIRHISKPFAGVQFHPESSPGPEDADWIFDDFEKMVRK